MSLFSEGSDIDAMTEMKENRRDEDGVNVPTTRQGRPDFPAPPLSMIGSVNPRHEPLEGLDFTSRRMHAAGGSQSHCIGAHYYWSEAGKADRMPLQSSARESSPASRGAMTLQRCYSQPYRVGEADLAIYRLSRLCICCRSRALLDLPGS